MKYRKGYIGRQIRDLFNIDRCITELSGYQILAELLVVLAVLVLVTSPAWLPELVASLTP